MQPTFYSERPVSSPSSSLGYIAGIYMAELEFELSISNFKAYVNKFYYL